MRYRFVLALGVGVAVMLAVPGAASAQAPLEDSVVGTVVVELGDNIGCDPRTFTFDAHSGPSGENPRGTVTGDAVCAPGPMTWAVACLSVVGNKASIGIEIVPGGSLVLLFVGDNGGTGQDEFLVGGTPPLGAPCPTGPGAGLDLKPILSGDIDVTDGQPFPISKAQCKNGGWRNYPGFKNQGDCVSFVATGGEQQP